MSASSSSNAVADPPSGVRGAVKGTVPVFAVGLVIVVVAGALVGPWTGSYVAAAFTAYFLTTVYDLVVDRLGYRETLLARVGDGGEEDG